MGTTGNVKEEIITKDEIEKKSIKPLLEKLKLVNNLCLPFLNTINIVKEEEEYLKLNEKGMISYLINIIKGNRLSERKTIELMYNVVDTIILVELLGIDNINLSTSNISFNENDDMIISDWYNCKTNKKVDYIQAIGKIFYSMMKKNNLVEVTEEIKNEEDIKLKLKYEKYSQLIKNMILFKPNEFIIEEIKLQINENTHKMYWNKNIIMKNLIKSNCQEIYYSDYHPVKKEIIQFINNEINAYNNNKNSDRMTININMCNLSNYGIEYLFDNINSLKDIKYLYMKRIIHLFYLIIDNDIDSCGMKYLSNYFIDIPLLSCLYLNDNLIDNESMKFFCEKCHYLNNLNDLNLSCILLYIYIIIII